MFAPLTILLSYIGSLPFGMINLNVLYAEMTQGRRAAVAMAFGAAIVEALQGITAAIVYFRLLHLSQIEPYLKIAATVVFAGFVIYHLSKRQSQQAIDVRDTTSSNASPLVKGLLLSSLNFMALPFWLIILTMLADWFHGEWAWSHMIIFGLCAGAGGFAASMTYAIAGRRFIQPDSWIYRHLDLCMAILFATLAVLIWVL